MRLRTVAAVLTAFAAAGCYESPVPLAPPSEAVVDTRLLGRWEAVASEDRQGGDLLVLRFNERELYARFQEEEGDETEHYRAYVVALDGARFLNAQDIEAGDVDHRPFFLFRYDIGPDSVLTLRMVSGRSFDKPIENAARLRRFIRANLENERLYESPDRFRRPAGDP